MRNKIRQMMKKEEGFTLVELLAVIVILGIIVAIAIPSIGNVVNRAETQAESAEEALVVDAARLYFIENDGNAVSEGSNQYTVTVAELVTAGYLDQRDVGDGDITGTVTRTITDEGGETLEFAAE